jgi:hypothetical protein
LGAKIFTQSIEVERMMQRGPATLLKRGFKKIRA